MTITAASDLSLFLRRAARHPALLGAPAPTGARLAAAVADLVPPRPATVVELGAGTGPITAALAARLRPGSRLVAVEKDPELAAHLRATHPGVEVVTGDATELAGLLHAHGVGQVDVLATSLPWTFLPVARRRALLADAAAALAPDGVFSLIRTMSAAPHLVREVRRDVEAVFTDVRDSATVWRNLPPSRLVIARGPRRTERR